MANIQWTRQYRVNSDQGQFKLFVSAHDNKLFFASLLYYVRTGAVNVFAGPPTEIEFKLQTEVAESEDEALRKIKEWIEKNLGQVCITELEM